MLDMIFLWESIQREFLYPKMKMHGAVIKTGLIPYAWQKYD